ncbi:putative fibronectin type III domain protein [Escherichia coli 2-427-07_S1_C3]|nr:putative fibronectin type III domain protein [Escherichia coli 2-427-07_S1_C3]
MKPQPLSWTALYWIAASINIRPGHNYYFYVRSVNTVGKSAFVEAVGQPSDDASGYLDFFKGEIGKTHLAQELWTQIDNGQLAPDLAEIRTSITDVSNEITRPSIRNWKTRVPSADTEGSG